MSFVIYTQTFLPGTLSREEEVLAWRYQSRCSSLCRQRRDGGNDLCHGVGDRINFVGVIGSDRRILVSKLTYT